jgi:cytochrome oxidase Cu insertion factor (SCO1/SenC/PrrC family)
MISPTLTLIALLLACCTLPAQAASAEAADAQQWEHSALVIPDIPVVDQHGRTLRFYTDLIKGKTVALNFIFTTCTTMCPPQTYNLRRVQQALGERVGREVTFISLSVDPGERPAALQKFARRFDIAPGWYIVSASKRDLDRLLTALGAFSNDKQNHSAMTLIGNEPGHYWTRMHSLSAPPLLVQAINQAASRTQPKRVEAADTRTSHPTP